MGSLEALTGTGVYARELGGVSAAPSTFVEATVATTPTAVDEEVMVLVGAEGSQLQAGPCRWAPRPGAQPWPRRGDPCLVVTGDRGHRALEWWKPAVAGSLRVTALPDQPFDGQVITYAADAANGVLWDLMYNAGSASPYKWEMVGGSAMSTQDDAPYGPFTNTTAAAQGSALAMTLPLAGVYDFAMSSNGAMGASDTNEFISSSLRVAGVVETSNLGVMTMHALTTALVGIESTRPNYRRTVAAASSAVTLVHSMSASGVNYFVRGRALTARPVRVG